jgi:hypothetical protein
MGTNTGFNNNYSNSEITRVPQVNYHETISQLSPAVISCVTAIANMAGVNAQPMIYHFLALMGIQKAIWASVSIAHVLFLQIEIKPAWRIATLKRDNFRFQEIPKNRENV